MKNKNFSFCTITGTATYKSNFNHFSKDAYNLNHQNLNLSSIGFGMYKGKYEKKQRINYQKIIKNFILNGVNVFDTARKYRNGYSEEDFGIVFLKLLKNKKINRDQIYISSKAGLINFSQKKNKISQLEILVKKRGINKSDIKNQIFCGNPKFLNQEINISLKKMKLKTLDNYYLHNPELLQGNNNKFKDYYKIFEMFEKAIQDNKIKSYGISSWAGFRRNKYSPFYIDIKKILNIAYEVGGKNNGFKNIQIPLSIYMPFTKAHYLKSRTDDLFSFLNKKKINIFSSASLYEGKIIYFYNLLKIFKSLNKNKKSSSYLLDELKINKISLPLSDHSLVQLFSTLNMISKKSRISLPKFDNQIYTNSLNFVRSEPNITSSLFGVDNIRQLNENMGILKNRKLNVKLINK